MESRVITPMSIIPQGGSTNGAVSRLWYLEQLGTDDVASAYVNFQTQSGTYFDYQSFYIPEDIQTNFISDALLQVNFNGPDASIQNWTWSIYDWKKGIWINLGDTIGSTANEWNSLTIRVRNIQRYISAGHEVRIQLLSSNDNGDLKVDYEAFHITYRAVAGSQHNSEPYVPDFPGAVIFALPQDRMVR
jgi:hypothetical protein